jgi:lysophospholipase L1-like esterase
MWKWILAISVVANVVLLVTLAWGVRKLGGWKYLLFRAKNDGIAALYEHRKNHLSMLTVDQTSVVMLGNSLTAFCEWAELMDNPNIKNRGISGDGTEGVLSRLSGITRGKPSVIFLEIGINDLLFLGNEQISKNYRKIVAQISQESPATRLYLQSILPVNAGLRFVPIDNQDIQELNNGIRQIASDYGATYLDLNPHFQDERGELSAAFTLDGVHLNEKGYALWKRLLEPHMP